MASQTTGVSIACSSVCSGADQRKHQSSASLAFVRGIHRWLVDGPHKGPVTPKMFPFDHVSMFKQKPILFKSLLLPCESCAGRFHLNGSSCWWKPAVEAVEFQRTCNEILKIWCGGIWNGVQSNGCRTALCTVHPIKYTYGPVVCWFSHIDGLAQDCGNSGALKWKHCSLELSHWYIEFIC